MIVDSQAALEAFRSRPGEFDCLVTDLTMPLLGGFDLVKAVAGGETVTCTHGGKEVYAADVAKAAELLLNAPAEMLPACGT